MLAALLKQKGGVGGTTIAPRLADQWAVETDFPGLVDADPRRDRFAARPTIEITAELRKRARVIASQREFSGSDTLRDLIASECHNDRGDQP
jgi:hypothetical protein